VPLTMNKCFPHPGSEALGELYVCGSRSCSRETREVGLSTYVKPLCTPPLARDDDTWGILSLGALMEPRRAYGALVSEVSGRVS
jgi:hypothetical protein